jgi:PilZ domain-containing protein
MDSSGERKRGSCRKEETHMAGFRRRLFEMRRSRRRELHAKVIIEHNEMKFSGELMNVSDKGAYLAVNGLYAINDTIDVTITFDHGATKLSISVPCRVTRIDGSGIGLVSSHIDATKLLQLELILASNIESSPQLVEEFYRTVL